MTLILSNNDIDGVLSMKDCIDVLEDAYRELAQGRGVSRTRSDSFSETTRPDALYSLKSMDGIVPKLGVGAVRINSDIITWPKEGGNEPRGKVPWAPRGRCVRHSKANRESFRREWSAKLGVKVVPVETPEEAIGAADIAMCATNTIDN